MLELIKFKISENKKFFNKKIIMLYASLLLFIIALILNNLSWFYQQDISVPSVEIKKIMQDAYINEWPVLANKTDPKVELRIKEIIQQLSVRQKIGQMIMLPSDFTAAEFAQFQIGAAITTNNTQISSTSTKIKHWLKVHDQLFLYSKDVAEKNSNVFIPPLIAVKAVHGNSLHNNGVAFAHNNGVGAIQDPLLIKKMGEAVAQQILNVGADWIVTGNSSVVRDIRSRQMQFSYSQNPLIAANINSLYYSGLKTTFNDERIVTSLSGFIHPNYVNAINDSINEETLLNLYLYPHLAAIEQGVDIIELSNSKINGVDINTNKKIITDRLKNTMQFDGVVMSYLNQGDVIHGCWIGNCRKIINAGVDLINIDPSFSLMGGHKRTTDQIEVLEKLFNNIEQDIANNKISMSRINDAVTRILRVKIRNGLFNKPEPSLRLNAGSIDKSVKKEIKQLSSEVAQKSSVLLKNNNKILPLKMDEKILLTGIGSEDLKFQYSSYAHLKTKGVDFKSSMKKLSKNITWVDPFHLSNTLVMASMVNFYDNETVKINRQLARSPIKVNIKTSDKLDVMVTSKEFDIKLKEYIQGFDKIVITVSEDIVERVGQFSPANYEQYISDVNGLNFSTASFAQYYQYQLFDTIKDLDIELVVVYFSDRPSHMPVIFDTADAFVAAWRPGSEMNAIAELLFANNNMDFSGKLSFSWPSHACQFDPSNNSLGPVLFKIGYGLNYQSNINIAKSNIDFTSYNCVKAL
ncbi:MAG: glycoside hydrolase family 3 C-terminal domain-containing protein [Saccharospirillaceae bacterium]|nr:glycoside hydrolase family 3 C-terminal domain-containing protein [Pseudomonadales bacterium]NRB77823.1 glycoside hydrolase family 3 C-terminal domain-containing protein [Saccharospirillaceae bacterium]